MTVNRPIVHILGLGAMGTVLAVDLLRFSNAMLIPLFRSEEKLNRFQNEFKSQIGIRKLYESNKPLYTFDIERSECPEKFGGEKIKNLVITTKTYQTKEAIAPYLPYIDNETNIILIQNGLGVLEVLKEEVFNNSSKPNLFQGVISHGVYQDKGFIYNHAGWVGMKIARLPWSEGDMIQTVDFVKRDTENELIKLLTQPKLAKDFGIEHMTYQEMLLGQLFKFLINSCMNPVTAIVDCVNGEMVDHCSPVFRSIIDECLSVLRVAYKPLFDYDRKYQGNDQYPTLGVNDVLQVDHMVKEVVDCGCVVNERNSSSMRQDTLYLRDTEIEYINGYIVKLAHDFKLAEDSCKVNKTISELVNLRLGLNRTRAAQGDWRK
ncbi:2-dehydropantoate 2-reductase [Nakaseomyces bracarensis]|uniref:2-dehydropantoate 2-reductase n=1 Tax=Nakaseomyces bracarensis TaxID=273131 RepID=A0ABR4NXG4_9SACH